MLQRRTHLIFPTACTQLQAFSHMISAQAPFSHHILPLTFFHQLELLLILFSAIRMYLLKGKKGIIETFLLSKENSGLWT